MTFANWIGRYSAISLERYCQRIGAADDPKGTTHERHLRVYRIIDEEDRDLGDMFNDLINGEALMFEDKTQPKWRRSMRGSEQSCAQALDWVFAVN